jgi:hypothetical protein
VCLAVHHLHEHVGPVRKVGVDVGRVPAGHPWTDRGEVRAEQDLVGRDEVLQSDEVRLETRERCLEVEAAEVGDDLLGT